MLTVFAACAAVLTLAACFFSYDFYHPDEYFQVMEYSNYKMGVTPPADLPWEFEARIRPWFQPAVYFLVIKVLSLVGIENPFVWAFFLRALSMCLSLVAIILLMKSSFLLFTERVRALVAVILLAFLCYIPYLSVRTSSETFSAALFWISVCTWVLGSRSEARKGAGGAWAKALLCGALFGLAFESRFQSAILIIGFLAWILVFAADRKTAMRSVGIMCSGALLLVGIGLIIDRWGYGEWTVTPFNYLYQNVVLKKADDFGTTPFWGYLTILTKESYGGGFILLACMVVSWFRRPKSIMTWISVPFFLIHCILPHKEGRFLFPLVLASPFFVVDAIAPGKTTGQSFLENLWRLKRSWAAYLLFAANLGAYVLLIISISQPTISVQRYLYGRRLETRVVYATSDANPYFWHHPMYFYRPKMLSVMILGGGTDTGPDHYPVILVSHQATPPVLAAGREAQLVYRTPVPLTDRLKSRLHIGRRTNNSALWPFYIYEVE